MAALTLDLTEVVLTSSEACFLRYEKLERVRTESLYNEKNV